MNIHKKYKKVSNLLWLLCLINYGSYTHTAAMQPAEELDVEEFLGLAEEPAEAEQPAAEEEFESIELNEGEKAAAAEPSLLGHAYNRAYDAAAQVGQSAQEVATQAGQRVADKASQVYTAAKEATPGYLTAAQQAAQNKASNIYGAASQYAAQALSPVGFSDWNTKYLGQRGIRVLASAGKEETPQNILTIRSQEFDHKPWIGNRSGAAAQLQGNVGLKQYNSLVNLTDKTIYIGFYLNGKKVHYWLPEEASLLKEMSSANEKTRKSLIQRIKLAKKTTITLQPKRAARFRLPISEGKIYSYYPTIVCTTSPNNLPENYNEVNTEHNETTELVSSALSAAPSAYLAVVGRRTAKGAYELTILSGADARKHIEYVSSPAAPRSPRSAAKGAQQKPQHAAVIK